MRVKNGSGLPLPLLLEETMEKKKVKKRQHMKAPKAADASRKLPRHMKTGYHKVDEQTVPADERYESESDFAAQKSEQYTYEVASVTYSGTKKAVKKIKEKVEGKIRDKVEDLENRREQKEAERLEQNQPRMESRKPDQQQTTETHQPSSNPSVQSEPHYDTSGHEIMPKEKADVLKRHNQPELKQSDDLSFRSSRPAPQEISPQQKAEMLQKRQLAEQRSEPTSPSAANVPKEITSQQKAEFLQQRQENHQATAQHGDGSPDAHGTAPKEISAQQKAEILQKQRTEPKETAQEHLPDSSTPTESSPAEKPQYEYNTQKGGDHHALQQTEQQSHSVENNQQLFRSDQRPAQKTNAAGQKSVSSVKQGTKGTVKTTEKTVKTTEKSVKTAERSVKTAEKSVKTAEKVGEKAAKVAKEVAVKAAKAAQKAAEMTAKAIQAAAKAIIVAVKALVAAIAAGGWVAVVIILVIALVAAIICICFGLFWSNDASPDGPTMTEIITRIDQSYKDAIDKRIKKFEKEIDHDEFEVVYRGDNNDGDSATVNNWIDVLAVYSVLSTTGDDPIIILVPDDECEQRLRDVFSVMNTVGFTYELHEVVPENAPTPTPDEEGNTPEPETVTQLIVNVHQRSMTYREAAEYYHFDESQMQLLEEMMSPAYTKYYAALIGVDLLGGADYTEIISLLPSNSKGADVVRAALTKLGCPYVWGAKGSTKFDCSGLAYWAIHEVDPELGDHMYTNAAGQAKYCHDRGLLVAWSELEPGDLVFWVNKKCEGCHRWKEIHHVGIYVGGGKVVEASSSKGCVVVRDLWQTKNYPIIIFGRPYQ